MRKNEKRKGENLIDRALHPVEKYVPNGTIFPT
jgi:hypothetical protein